MPQKKQTITVGRDSKNSVVLDESNVSSFHARLICSSDKIVLEDLGSTNGTSVGRVENKVQRSDVKLDDTVFFGSTPCRVSDLINSSVNPVDKPQQAAHIKPAPRESKSGNAGLPGIAWVGFAALAVVVGLGLFAWNASDRDDPILAGQSSASTPATQPARGASPSKPTLKPTSKPTSKPDLEDAVSTNSSEIGDDESPVGSAEISLSATEKLERAVFVVVCSNKKRNTSYRIGTAFSIDARHVATSASVIQAMRNLKADGYAEVALRSPTTGKTLTLSTIRVHPQYETMSDKVKAAQREHDSIQDELRSKPPTREAYELVKESLLATRMKAVQAMENKTSYDVAVIELRQSLDNWLAGVPESSSLRPNLKLEVAGYGIDESDPYFDESDAIELLTMNGRVRQLVRSSSETPLRLLASGAGQQLEYSFSGSPVVNAQGQVIAIYSRPTPVRQGVSESQNVATFDAPLFERIRECLED